MENLENYLQEFLVHHYKSGQITVNSLAGDASNRRYYRVIHDGESSVLMQWEPFLVKDYPFLSVLEHFAKNNIKVPEVLAMSEKSGLVLLEDLGDLTLERRFWESQNPEKAFPFYKLAVDELIKIHFGASADKSECTAFKIQFDTAKFLWELNYGKDNLLEGVLDFKMSEAAKNDLQKVFVDICQRLDREPKFISHRDYHSRNLMIKLNEMRVIDFQDARLGPIQYDLVSLVRDSYVAINDKLAGQIIEYYLQSAKDYLPTDFSKSHFEEIYEVQSIQRCFKACGSFASFFHQRQDRRYLKYLPGTLKKVLKSLTGLPEYKFFSEIIIDSGALEKDYDNL